MVLKRYQKPFTVAAALEAGIVKPDTPIQTAPGTMTIGGWTISDSHPHGILTVQQVIQKSSNVGTAKIQLQMAAEDVGHFYRELGFGAPPQTGFPGVAKGLLRPAAKWRPVEQATMAYGHGISVSLLQIARAYTVFTNDGHLLPLSLVRRDTHPIGRQLVSPRTAREVALMLEMAVGPGGTAPRAAVPGYRVAGKTGTAHKPEAGGYAATETAKSNTMKVIPGKHCVIRLIDNRFETKARANKRQAHVTQITKMAMSWVHECPTPLVTMSECINNGTRKDSLNE